MRFTAILPAILLAGCLGASDTPTVSLAVSPESANLAEEVQFTVTSTIHRRFTYEHPGCGAGEVFATVMLDEGATRIGLYRYGEEPLAGTCAFRDVTAEPGTSTTLFDWNGRAEHGQDGGPHGGERVPPGTYTVFVSHVSGEATTTATVTVE